MCEVFRKGYSPCGKWFFDAMKAEHGHQKELVH